MAYRAKRKRHVCSTKGCRNREVILYSKNGEIGGGLYLCKECIEALGGFLPQFETEKNNKATESAQERSIAEADSTDDEIVKEALPEEYKPKKKKKENK